MSEVPSATATYPTDVPASSIGLPPSTFDSDEAVDAAARFLTALGADVTDENLRETPRRMAAAFRHLVTPVPFQMTTFTNEQGYDELIVATNIPFASLCEHHVMPIVGVAHVGYLPGSRIVGLSKLGRIVHFFARGFQVQERLTQQIADCLVENLQPRGAGVVLDAEHMCMTLRGVQAVGSRTVTSALAGYLRDRDRSRQEFLAATGIGK